MRFEQFLQKYYGVKQVYLTKPRLAARNNAANRGDIKNYLTVFGVKAYTKLVGLLYDLETIEGGNFKAAPWAKRLNEIAAGRGLAGIKFKPQNYCLDSILQNHFGCKRVFLKKPKVVGYYLGGEPEPDYQYFTSAGGRAYCKLTSLIYGLEELLGEDFGSHNLVETLDSIVREDF